MPWSMISNLFKESCGDRPKIIGWLALSPSEEQPIRGDVVIQNPYLGPLEQKEHVRGVIPSRTFQNPNQGCVLATVVLPPST